jgi:hypothetical protein
VDQASFLLILILFALNPRPHTVQLSATSAQPSPKGPRPTGGGGRRERAGSSGGGTDNREQVGDREEKGRGLKCNERRQQLTIPMGGGGGGWRQIYLLGSTAEFLIAQNKMLNVCNCKATTSHPTGLWGPATGERQILNEIYTIFHFQDNSCVASAVIGRHFQSFY